MSVAICDVVARRHDCVWRCAKAGATTATQKQEEQHGGDRSDRNKRIKGDPDGAGGRESGVYYNCGCEWRA